MSVLTSSFSISWLGASQASSEERRRSPNHNSSRRALEKQISSPFYLPISACKSKINPISLQAQPVSALYSVSWMQEIKDKCPTFQNTHTHKNKSPRKMTLFTNLPKYSASWNYRSDRLDQTSWTPPGRGARLPAGSLKVLEFQVCFFAPFRFRSL